MRWGLGLGLDNFTTSTNYLLLPCSTKFCCRDAINDAVKYKDNPTDIEDQILEELDKFTMEEPRGVDLEL